MEICTFASRMKKLLMNMSAVLLAVWYCMSIIGFDVHTCMSSGRTFIAAFTEGVACSDIHPEHHCCGASCCSGHHHHEASCCSSEHCDEMPSEHNSAQTSVDAKSCCSNEYQVILLSGCRTDYDSDEKHSFSKVSYPCILDIPVAYIAMAKYHADHIQFLEPDSGVHQPGDLCVAFGVWRI